MIHYILQIILFQLLFLIVYDLFLKKETFFYYNRLYLLVTSVLSFVIPFLKIEAIQQTIPLEYRVQLPAVLIGNAADTSSNTSIFLNEILVEQQSISWSEMAIIVYGVGAFVALLIFMLKLRKLQQLKKKAVLEKFENYSLATLPNSEAAFTFMKTVFLGDAISIAQKNQIVKHELVHVQQRHSLDLLFFEFLRIICWFNPLVYITQNKLQALHEYAADRIVASSQRTEYYQSLLQEVFGTTTISFINTFYKSSIIKKRIIMLQKTNSKKIVQLKYLLLIPAVFAMLLYTSCSEDTADKNSDLVSQLNNLSAEIASKGELTQEEKGALAQFIYHNYPEGTEGISGEKGNILYEKYLEQSETENVPFATIEKVPTYPGCEGANEEMKKCMADKISAFVAKNFNTKLEGNLSGRQRISVQFKINETGKVSDVRARAASPALETEAMRVVSSLPTMIPGEHEGKVVSVLYALPIVFEINE